MKKLIFLMLAAILFCFPMTIHSESDHVEASDSAKTKKLAPVINDEDILGTWYLNEYGENNLTLAAYWSITTLNSDGTLIAEESNGEKREGNWDFEDGSIVADTGMGKSKVIISGNEMTWYRDNTSWSFMKDESSTQYYSIRKLRDNAKYDAKKEDFLGSWEGVYDDDLKDNTIYYLNSDPNNKELTVSVSNSSVVLTGTYYPNGLIINLQYKYGKLMNGESVNSSDVILVILDNDMLLVYIKDRDYFYCKRVEE